MVSGHLRHHLGRLPRSLEQTLKHYRHLRHLGLITEFRKAHHGRWMLTKSATTTTTSTTTTTILAVKAETNIGSMMRPMWSSCPSQPIGTA